MTNSPRKDPMLGRRLFFSFFSLFSFFASVLAAAGCASQAGTSYRGEPLAVLRGSVEASTSSATASPPAPLAAALLWNGLRPNADAKASVSRRQVGTSVPVTGQFPAQFALQVYTPPPEGALFTCFAAQPDRPGSIATARIAAVLEGTSTTTLKQTDLYGYVSDFLVVYVDADLPAVSDCPGGALTKGYHLFRSVPTEDKPGCIRQAPDDPSCNGPWPFAEVAMTTELTLVLSHESGDAQPPAPSPPPSGP